MISEVPFGAFLSGGVDSSTIVALMQKRSERPVKTFTIGFDDSRFSEAADAREVANHLSTEHTELRVTGDDALSLVPRLPEVWCEPFADSSQLPTLLLCHLARQHVTVALSGDGGDEIFGGYNRHIYAPESWRNLRRLPRPIRRFIAGMLQVPGERTWERIASMLMPLVPSNRRVTDAGYKIHKLARAMGESSGEMMYMRLVSQWQEPTELVLGSQDIPTWFERAEDWRQILEPEHRMMLLDTLSYLPDDILTKVDRAGMAVSLETRMPFLSESVARFAWSLPLTHKIDGGQGKLVLRNVLDRYVPRHLIERPKHGFEVPLNDWLRGSLREWAESLLAEDALSGQGFLDASLIRQRWREHISGTRNWQHQLWSVLMFQTWLEHQAR